MNKVPEVWSNDRDHSWGGAVWESVPRMVNRFQSSELGVLLLVGKDGSGCLFRFSLLPVTPRVCLP